MSKKEVVWTELAEKELQNIINYWNQKNQSTKYTSTLRSNLSDLITLLSFHPNIGRRSIQRKSIRLKVFMTHFLLIYRIEIEKLYILDFWDSRKILKLMNTCKPTNFHFMPSIHLNKKASNWRPLIF